MEVHHHSHHERRNWKSYFWEFLMLFLAVLCGYFAEYKLEHVIERQREKKYMELMVEDLKNDTIEIKNTIDQINKILLPALNKSTTLLYLEDVNDSVVREIYNTIPKSLFSITITLHDGTAVQLKNSGNLRLIEDMKIATNLTNYWTSCNLISNKLFLGYNDTRNNSKDIVFGLLNLNYYENNTPYLPLKPNANPKLITYDKGQLLKLGNNYSNLQSQLSGPILDNLKNLSLDARSLIKQIKKEYQIQ